MRRGWKYRLLALLLLAILWILVVPNADLDPATPLSLEVLFFVAVAISFIADTHAILRSLLRNLMPMPHLLSLPGSASLTARIAPLRC